MNMEKLCQQKNSDSSKKFVLMPLIAIRRGQFHYTPKNARPRGSRRRLAAAIDEPLTIRPLRHPAQKRNSPVAAPKAQGGSGGVAAGGGRSEVKRRRAGPPHVEPRAESPSEAAQPEPRARNYRRRSAFRADCARIFRARRAWRFDTGRRIGENRNPEVGE